MQNHEKHCLKEQLFFSFREKKKNNENVLTINVFLKIYKFQA